MSTTPVERIVRTPETDRRWVEDQMLKAQRSGFYGRLVFILEDGRIVRLVREESLKPTDYRKEGQ